jgi:hypothetical protein
MVGVLVAVIGCVGSAIGTIFYGGKLVGRIESVADKFDAMQSNLDKIPVIEQRLEFQEEWLRRLDQRHESTRAHAIVADDRTSKHDGE